MKKLFSLILALLLLITLGACGKLGGRADDALVGKYVTVSGTAMGVTLSGDDMAGFKLELMNGGKAKLNVEGTTAEVFGFNRQIGVLFDIVCRLLLEKKKIWLASLVRIRLHLKAS